MKARSELHQVRRKDGGPYHDPAEVSTSPWDGKPIPVADLRLRMRARRRRRYESVWRLTKDWNVPE